jgi:alpha-amylase/alpha-mannosidase (GH57 family)
MNEVITNTQGWFEDFDAWMDVEVQAEKWEEIKRLEEEYKGYGWDDEEE